MTPPKPLVLVVDDDDGRRYTKTRILRKAEFEVIDAINGADGLALVLEKKPRLAILDVGLPDINGWELCRRIKNRTDMVPPLVLQVSATFVSEADTVAALEAGADACLTEPIEAPVLVATVRALLRARQAEEDLRAALDREQVARNAAEAANRSKDEFLAVLSHELRSPLGAILTWITLLRSGSLDPQRTARGLEAIERNARVQAKLIEDLLDTSRIISGKMVLDVSLVELGPIVETVVDAARTAAEAKSIRLHAAVDPGVGPLSGDPMRLQQVIWNLVSNAVKFTPRGGRVDVRVEALDSEAQIQVQDTGKGIASGFLPHVFDRFRQADSSTSRAEGGLGLGLAIVRHLVELHGGTVTADSPGESRGATFTIRLPLPAVRVASGSVSRGSRRILPRVLRRLDGLRVLVVDDEADARDAIAAVLEECGAVAVAAESGSEAVALFERSKPRVVVSDIGMPYEDGYVLIDRIGRLQAEAGSRVPVIALTAYAGGAERQKILDAGFTACITKPVEANELVEIVAELGAKSP